MHMPIVHVEFVNDAHATMWRMGDTLYSTFTYRGHTTPVDAIRIYPRERGKSLYELAEEIWEAPESITIR